MRKGVHSYRTSFGSQKTVPSYVALIPATDEQMKEYLNDGRERKRVYVPTQYKICRLCNGKGYITKEKRRGQMMAEREYLMSEFGQFFVNSPNSVFFAP